jgi:hypothetical protein
MCSAPLVNARASADDIETARARRGEASILAVIADRNLVFNEEQQAVYELDDLAAYVWRSFDAGMRPDQIVREINLVGVDHHQATRAVELALESLGALRHATGSSPPPSLPKPTERLIGLTILIADVAVQLHLSKALVADVQAAFGRLITDLPESDAQLCARAVGRTVEFFAPGQPEWSCERSHFIPLLKAQFVECVLKYARYEVALHAAVVALENSVALLVGSPGAGKTTLAIALARAGLEVVADDVALLNERGGVTGVPMPLAAKASSWPLISRHWPDIATQPSHYRPDGQKLCYLHQDTLADPGPRPIGQVILLNRQDRGGTRVEELDPVCALGALVAEGATRDGRLSLRGFTALVEGLREARCCRLTYSDLLEAADAVCSLRS